MAEAAVVLHFDQGVEVQLDQEIEQELVNLITIISFIMHIFLFVSLTLCLCVCVCLYDCENYTMSTINPFTVMVVVN